MKEPKNPDFVLAGTRTWVGLERCAVDLATWLELKLNCTPPAARHAATWAQEELQRRGEKWNRD